MADIHLPNPRICTRSPHHRVRPVNLFLSSPADVRDERLIVGEVVGEFGEQRIWGGLVVAVHAYERRVPSQMGRAAQAVVNTHMIRPEQCDIYVGLFCHRYGTPHIDEETGDRCESGTRYEFDRAYAAYRATGRPVVMLYRGMKSLPATATRTDRRQFDRVCRFFEREVRSGDRYDGLYGAYDSPEQFRRVFRRDLSNQLFTLLQGRQQ